MPVRDHRIGDIGWRKTPRENIARTRYR